MVNLRLYDNTQALAVFDCLVINGYVHINNASNVEVRLDLENNREMDVNKQMYSSYREVYYIDIHPIPKKYEFYCTTVDKQKVRNEKLEQLFKSK